MGKSDAIRFACVSCGRKYKVPATAAGRGMRCKSCRTKLQVPAPSAESEADDFIGLADDDAPAAAGTARPQRHPCSRPPSKTAEPLRAEDAAKPRRVAKRDAGATVRGPSARKDKATPRRGGPDTAPDWSLLLGDPVGGAEEAGGVADAGVSPVFDNLGRASHSGTGREGFSAALVSIREALVDSFRPGATGVPAVRRVSLGGLFITLAGVLTLVLTAWAPNLSDPATALRAQITDPDLARVASLSPAASSGIVLGSVGLVVGLLLVGRRLISPRLEPESPLVLLCFWAFVLMSLVTGAVVLVGPASAGVSLIGLVALAILLAALLLGGWVLVRMNMAGDGNGIMLMLFPAVAVPTYTLVSLIYRSHERAVELGTSVDWAAVDWGRLLLVWLITAVVMLLMGGVVGVWVLLAVPFFLLAASMSGADFQLGMGGLVWGLVVLCYLWLFVTRWRIVLKPVGWQFAVLVFGFAMVGQGLAISTERVLVADQDARISNNDGRWIGPGRDPVAGNRSLSPQRGSGNSGGGADSYYSEEHGFHILYVPASDRYHIALAPMYLVSDTGLVRSNAKGVYITSTIPPPRAPAVQGFGAGHPDWRSETDMLQVFSTPARYAVSGGRTLNLNGCLLQVPPGCTVESVSHPTFNRSVEAVILVRGIDNAQLKVRVEPLDPSRLDRRQRRFEEVRRDLASHAARVDQTEYGWLGGLVAMRVEEYPMPTGEVLFYAEQHDDSPVAITVSYSYSSRSPGATETLEAVARSLVVPDDQPAVALDDPAVLTQAPAESELREGPTTRWGVPIGWKTSYLLALPQYEALTTYAHREHASYNIAGLDGTGGSSGNDDIKIYMYPLAELPPVAHRVAYIGAFEHDKPQDPFISAPGASVSYHRLWADQVFVRLDRGLQQRNPHGDSAPVNRVTYAGYLGGFLVKIDLFDSVGSNMSIAELEDLLLSVRLQTAEEAVRTITQSSELTGWLEAGIVDLPLQGGTYTSTHTDWPDWFTPPNTVPDSGGGVPGVPADAAVYPELPEAQLAPYGIWDIDPAAAEHLAREPVELDGFALRPLAALRLSEESRRGLRWSVAGGMSGVGMTMQLDVLDDETRRHLIPVLEETLGRQSFQIGNRVIRSRGGAEVTYREQSGIRVWRILMPSVGDHEAQTCYYIARTPTEAVVLRVRFNPTKPEQLHAFDAAAATLRPLSPIAPPVE